MRLPRPAPAAALAGSVMLHVAVLLALPARDPPAAVAGGGAEASVRLGTAFDDIAAGTLQPTAARHDPAPRADAAQVPRSDMHPAPTASQPEATSHATPRAAAVADGAAVAPNTQTTDAPAPGPSIIAAAPLSAATLPGPVAASPVGTHSASAPATTAPSREAMAAPPVTPEATHARPAPAPAAPARTAAAADLRGSPLAPGSAPLPPRRPDGVPQSERTVPAATSSPRDAAEFTARAGDASGQPDAVAPQAARRAAPAEQAGDAARANYSGEVIRRLRATPQARVRGRGEVTVGFTITANGGVAALAVQRGSDQPTLDAAALDHIRRAAPFPSPPPGAQTRFTLPITFR